MNINLRKRNLFVGIHKLTVNIWRDSTYRKLVTRFCKFSLWCKRRKNKNM